MVYALDIGYWLQAYSERNPVFSSLSTLKQEDGVDEFETSRPKHAICMPLYHSLRRCESCGNTPPHFSIAVETV
jgi:hypothetical protein